MNAFPRGLAAWVNLGCASDFQKSCKGKLDRQLDTRTQNISGDLDREFGREYDPYLYAWSTVHSLAPSASSSAFNDIDAFVVVVDRARETLTLSAPLSSDNGIEQASLKPTWRWRVGETQTKTQTPNVPKWVPPPPTVAIQTITWVPWVSQQIQSGASAHSWYFVMFVGC